MKRVNVDTAPAAVKKFLRSLPVVSDGVELELAGRVIGKFVPFSELSDSEKSALLARGRELVKRARERNQDVPARVLQREVRQALADVRGRRRQ